MTKALQCQIVRERKVMFLLSYLGLSPFIIAIASQVLSLPIVGYASEVVFASYSVVILSFLCGIMWGRCLHTDDNKLFYFVASNFFALLAWAALLSQHYAFSFAVLIVSYILVFVIEARQTDKVDKYYIRMRAILTCAVVVLHIVMLIVH